MSFHRRTFLQGFHEQLKDLARETGLYIHRQRVLHDTHIGLRGPLRGTLWIVPRSTDGTCCICPRGQDWALPVEQYLKSELGPPTDYSRDTSRSPQWRTEQWEIVCGAARIMSRMQGVK